MYATKEELVENYKAMETEAILLLVRQGLTKIAEQIAIAELASRGIAPPSLIETFHDLDSDLIHEKLNSGELDETAKAIAIEELDRRQRDNPSEVMASITPSEIDAHQVSSTESTKDWGFWRWAILFTLCLSVVLAFGTAAKNKIDQFFLYEVIFIQSLALAGIVRTFIAVFSSKGLSSIIVKIIAICMLCGILLSLSVCSLLAQHGWGGG